MNHEELRRNLCELGSHIRAKVLQARRQKSSEALSGISNVTAADTIYAIDKVSEEAIEEWFSNHWPDTDPVQVVMEGVDDSDHFCFPRGTPVEATKWKCLLDPIDGTRCIMHDKRSAWALAGIAPQRGGATRLSDIVAAAMTELPTTKQWRSDQISAAKGEGLKAESLNVLDGTPSPLVLTPSSATDFQHGFSWMAKYFPEGRTLTAQIEEALWDEISPPGPSSVFDDQYISTGGAFYELLAGHDRMIGDLRPLVYACLDLESPLLCHPYDVCAALLLDEAGIIYQHPLGGFPDAPLDTTSGIAWVAYANPFLAGRAQPVLEKILRRFIRP